MSNRRPDRAVSQRVFRCVVPMAFWVAKRSGREAKLGTDFNRETRVWRELWKPFLMPAEGERFHAKELNLPSGNSFQLKVPW